MRLHYPSLSPSSAGLKRPIDLNPHPMLSRRMWSTVLIVCPPIQAPVNDQQTLGEDAVANRRDIPTTGDPDDGLTDLDPEHAAALDGSVDSGALSHSRHALLALFFCQCAKSPNATVSTKSYQNVPCRLVPLLIAPDLCLVPLYT